jgi:hypothetical protein
MNFDYTAMQYKVQDLQREATQRRLAREAQAENEATRSLALHLEKISQQISARYAHKGQLPVVPISAEVCCSAA